MKQQPAKGRTAKHTGTAKHSQATKKHHPTRHRKAPAQTGGGKGKGAPPVAKHPQHHKPRQLSLAGEVACCAAEALAASLRLAGWPVGDDDVLALYRLTAADDDAGASLLTTLEMAAEFGIAGVRLASFRPLHLVQDDVPLPVRQGHADGLDELDHVLGRGCHEASVILGVELPGPHAVCADGGAWWSWGEPWCPCAWPDAVIEEAWSVRWPSWQ